MIRYLVTAFLLLGLLPLGGAPRTEKAVQKLHLVQDDAQDDMVSKIYRLQYVQANDLTPFVMGIVMRYNINSSVNCIEFGNNRQWLTVTCPERAMRCVDEFVAKADRPVKIDGKVPGEIIKGTGITRAVYRPRYRSGEQLIGVLINSVIGEGPYGSVYGWDKNSNQIYWKDNSSNTEYVYQFLTFLDRPAPQVTLHFTLTEVRESDLKDLGIEYLAWKNGPGLDLFGTAWDVFSVSSAGSAAISAASGPLGGFFFAPQFDASFIRCLGQSGKAKITARADLTVTNSDKSDSVSTILFDPQLQNITKGENDFTSVTYSALGIESGFHQAALQISTPIVNIHYGKSQSPYPASEAFSVNAYQPGDYAKYGGTFSFSYRLQTAGVVERNNAGNQLVDTAEIVSNALIDLNTEVILAQWDKETEVEETIGVPFLVRIPILKYLFSTTTTRKEKTRLSLSVKAELLNTAAPDGHTAGELIRLK